MGFTFRRIEKAGNESLIEEIHQDYHNGLCILLEPSGAPEVLGADLSYMVIDFHDHLVLVYP
jgi:hypothetical protein